MSTKIKYKGETVTSIEGGQTATLHLTDKKLTDDLIIEADGSAAVTTEEVTATPTKETQILTPTDGAYFSKVTVEAIPDEYEIPTYFNAETDIEIGESASLISFTIDGTEYQAVEGMTWGEWVDSEYNTGDFYLNDFGTGQVMHNHDYVVDQNNETQASITPISKDGVYNLTYVGGGN